MFFPVSSLTQVELASAIVRNPLVVTPDTTVMEAIAQMSGMRALCQTSSEAHGELSVEIEARSSCVVIVENHQPVGILTERDVVRLITQKAALETLPICDVMTRGLITLRESELSDLFGAIELLHKHKIRHLPILDEHDCLVGLLTHESLRQVSRPADLLRLRTVAEVMTAQVVFADPDIVMREIACRMTKHRVSSVVIVQTQCGDGQETLKIPIGLVTERDVVQFLALSLDFETSQVQSVMSTPIFSVQLEEPLSVVQQMMKQYRIQRLVVTGSQGELLGIITQTSLLQALNPLELYNLAKVLEEKVLQLETEKIQILQNRTSWLEQQVEERTTTLKAKAEQERLIATISSQIRSSLDLPAILNTTVEAVRIVLGCDRVAIWQIRADRYMLGVAESGADPSGVQVERLIYDPFVVPDWLEAYHQGKVQVVPDIYTTEMTDCHRELLEQLQIRAKVLIPIIQEHALWGLLEAVESHAPRQWQAEEVAFLEQLATQLAIAIQRVNDHQQLQEELQARQQLILQLQASEQRYATLASMAPVGIFRADASGRYTYTNERWHQFSGLTQAEALGWGWEQGVYPDDRDMVVAEWYRATHENHAFSLEYRLQRPDGAVTWVYGQSVAERDAHGDLIGYVGTITDISDRKQAEINLHQFNQTLEAAIVARTQALQAREAQLFDLFDDATDLIQSVSPEGQLLFVNRAWKETLGYSEHELAQLSIFQIIHPDELAHCQTMMAHLFAGEPCFGIETRFLTKDGREIMVEGNVNGQLQDGQLIATRGIFRDITARKQAENALRESQQFLQTVLNTFPLAVFWKDRNLKLLGCNQRFAQLLGLASPLEGFGRSNFDFSYTEAEAQGYSADDRQVMESGTAKLGIEETITLPSGEQLWLETNKVPLRDLAGNVVGVVGTFQNISDRKMAEAALTASESFNRQLVEEFPIGLASCRLDGQLVYVNSAFARILGRTTEEILSLTYWDITPIKYAEQEAEQLQSLKQHGRYGPYEKEYIHSDGHLVPVLLTGIIIRQNGEEFIWSTIQDISDRKHAEEEIQRTNQELARATRLKDEFLANMSHELRTPLNAILGLTEGLQEDVFGVINQRQIEALQIIEESGLHLLSLINDILDVAKIESGQIKLECTSISVTHLCSSSLAFIKQLALQQRIQLETKLDPDLTNLFVDERRMRQVLINLLSNAVKFTSEGGKITLTASRLPQADDATEQPYLRIAVLDTGIGIAPENINKLFQPFVQIDSALNRQYTGTGLGLALAKQIVELHRGRVGLTSELGMGSCFTIDLPCEPKPTLAPNPPMLPMTGQDDIASTVSDAPLTAPLILLAEDNEANISTISSYLTAQDYRVISAKNGKEAIAMACTESPDLILMDIQMPEMDGLAAIQQLRHDPNCGNIPIIALTALAMAGDRERCLDAGANDYLSKPVRLKDLASTIHQLLSGSS